MNLHWKMQVHKAALPPCYISKNEEPANGIAGSFMLDISKNEEPANGIAGSFMLDRELSEAHSRWTTCGAKHRPIRTKNSSNSA